MPPLISFPIRLNPYVPNQWGFMNKKRKIILEMLELDQSISSAQKSQIESILRNKLTSQHPILLKQREVAQLMSVSRQTVYHLKKLGVIRPIRITSEGCERYKRQDILDLINNGIPQSNRGNP